MASELCSLTLAIAATAQVTLRLVLVTSALIVVTTNLPGASSSCMGGSRLRANPEKPWLREEGSAGAIPY